MKTLVKKLRQFLRQCGGPTAVEYAVLLVLLIFGVMTAVSLLGASVGSSISSTAEALPSGGSGEDSGESEQDENDENGNENSRRRRRRRRRRRSPRSSRPSLSKRPPPTRKGTSSPMNLGSPWRLSSGSTLIPRSTRKRCGLPDRRR